MTEASRPASGLSTASWALGLAACLCNLMMFLLPIGLLLGIISLVLGTIHWFRSRDSRSRAFAGLTLPFVSFVIAAILVGTVVSVFVVDPTLL